jgi:hypothetical protein
MEKESSGQGPVEANSTGGQGSRRAVAPRDDDDDDDDELISPTSHSKPNTHNNKLKSKFSVGSLMSLRR